MTKLISVTLLLYQGLGLALPEYEQSMAVNFFKVYPGTR